MIIFSGGNPYLYNTKLGGKALGAFDDPKEVVLFYEQTPTEDGKRIVAFLDGHVEMVSEVHWMELADRWGI